MTYETPFDEVDVDFPKRIQNAVHKMFVVDGGRRLDTVTVGDICKITVAEWMKVPRVGRISVGEMMVLLAENGLELANKRRPESPEPPLPPVAPVPVVNPIFPMKIRKALPEVERSWLLAALEEAGGNIALASRLVGLTRWGLTLRLQKFGLHRPKRPAGP
jgi:DNA-binding NtrC family response regulator